MNDKLQLFFDRYSRLQKFKQFEVPKRIMKEAENLIAKSIASLKEDGIDVMAYLTTTEGAVEYEMYIATNKIEEDTFEMCGRCDNNSHVPGDEEDYRCLLDVKDKVFCTQFSDCGKEFAIRIQQAYHTCSKCKDCLTSIDKELNVKIHYCKLHKNAFECLKEFYK